MFRMNEKRRKNSTESSFNFFKKYVYSFFSIEISAVQSLAGVLLPMLIPKQSIELFYFKNKKNEELNKRTNKNIFENTQ